MNPDLLTQLPPELFPGVIYIYDLENSGNFFMNSKFEDILGYDREQVNAMGNDLIATLIHPEDRPRVERVMEELAKVEPGTPVRTEYRLRDRDGNWRWFADSACVCQTNEEGSIAQIVGTALEITETRDASEAYEQVLHLFQLVMEMVPLAVHWKDAQGSYLGYNRNFLLSAGLPPETDIRGKTDAELPWKEVNAERFRAAEKAVMESGKPDEGVLEEYERDGGETVVFRARRAPIREYDETIGVLCVHEDVTENVLLPRALEALEARVVFLMQTAAHGMFIVDAESRRIFEVNQAAAILMQREPKDVIKSALDLHFEEEEQPALIEWLGQAEEGESLPERMFTLLDRDGQCVPLGLRARRVQVENRQVVRIDARDLRASESGVVDPDAQKDAGEVEAARAAAATATEAAQSASADATKKAEALASLQTELDTLKQALSEAKQSVEKEQTARKQAENALSEQVAKAEAAIAERDALAGKLEASEKSQAELQELLDNSREEVTRLEEAQSQQSQDDKAMQRVQSELEETRSKLESVEKLLATREAECEELKSKSSASQSELDALTAQVGALKEDKNRFEQEQQKLEQQCHLLESERDEAKAERDTLAGKHEGLVEDLEHWRQKATSRSEIAGDLDERLPLARVALDTQYNILEWNEAARQLFGHESEDVLGQSLVRLLVARKERPKFKGFLDAVMEKKLPRNELFENLKTDRSTVPCRWYFSPRRRTEEKPTGGVDAFIVDMSAPVSVAPGVVTERTMLRDMFEAHSLPMLAVDAETLELRETNRAAERLYGYSSRALQRKRFDALSLMETDVLRERLETYSGQQSGVLELRQKSEGESVRLLECFVSAFWDEHNRKHYFIVMNDVTEQRSHERQLLEEASRLDAAMRTSGDGVVDWSPVHDDLYCSDSLKQMLGFESGIAWRRFDDLIALIHLEDLGRVREQLNQINNRTRERLDLDMRLRARNGDYRWMRLRASGFYEEDEEKLTRLVGVFSDITTLKRVSEDLRRARNEAEIALRAKVSFLAQMSHEIRTPLNAVLGFLELLRESTLDVDQRDYVERMSLSGNALLEILDNVLDISRIESERLELELSFVDPRSFVEDVIGKFKRQADMRGVDLDFAIDSDLPNSFEADPVRLKQILMNLLSNAVKFTEQGRVHVRLTCGPREQDETELRIQVMDTGCGIAEEDKRKIFRVFAQADHALSRKYGGVGLGLALCDRLARLMKGSITLESEEGEGSTFTLRLRVRVSDSPAFISARSGDNPFRKPLRERRPLAVLFVDDSPLHQDVGQAMLEKLGHEPCVVYNAEDAQILLEDESYDVLLIDLDLPGMDPLDLVRDIRGQGERSTQPYVITVSQSYSERLRKTCLAAGVDDCITTPLRREVLERALNQVYVRRG